MTTYNFPAASNMMKLGKFTYMNDITNRLAKIEEAKNEMKETNIFSTDLEYDVRIACEEYIESLYMEIEEIEFYADERFNDWVTD